MAIDAAGRQIDIEPTYDSGNIFLEIPASYMMNVVYPLLVDPWIDTTSLYGDGNVSNSVDPSGKPSICVDLSDNIFIAYEETISAINQIVVQKFDGTSWTNLSFPTGVNGSFDPSIATNSSGNPYVVWVDGTGDNSEILLNRHNGSSWQATATNVSSTTGNTFESTDPVIVINSSNRVFIAWEEAQEAVVATDTDVYVTEFTGTLFQGLPASDGAFSNISSLNSSLNLLEDQDPTMILDLSGNPIVAWDRNLDSGGSGGPWNIYLKRYDGSLWEGIAGSESGTGISATNTQSHNSNLAIDFSGNPFVTWIELESISPVNHQVYVKKFNGTFWAEISNSASTGGITSGSSPFISNRPSIAINRQGSPIVSWSENMVGTEDPKVFLRFNGQGSWSGLEYSATGLGVSNSSGFAENPDLVLDSLGNPVLVWQDDKGGSGEIFVRKWVQSSPLQLAQVDFDASTLIPTGGLIEGTSVVLKGIPFTQVSGLSVRIQVEVQPVGSGFSGVPNGESSLVSSGGEAFVTLTNLSKGSKHWRVRTIDSQGFGSPWSSFGGNADGDIDFAVLEYSESGGGGGSGLCGLLGFEAVLFIGILFFLRRRI